VAEAGAPRKPVGPQELFPGLKSSGDAMAGYSVWRGPRPFARWAAICAHMAFYGTQVWQVVVVLHVRA
jgi:hypothetical protein